MQEDIRIVLVGDPGCGKSTLVTSLISDRYIEEVSDCISEFIISPEVTGEPVTTRIVDTHESNPAFLRQQIEQADAIIVVYSVVESTSFDRITVHWLPYIEEIRLTLNSNNDNNNNNNNNDNNNKSRKTKNKNKIKNNKVCPIILAGNKLDLCTDEYDLEEQILPITTQYKEVEQCFETSAKELINIAELFSCAQHAVIHPTAPLYDSMDHTMTIECIDAFSRIFKLVDKDRDGLLNDYELSELQRRCFDKPLQIGEIEKVREVVRANVPDGLENNHLNEKGMNCIELYCIVLYVCVNGMNLCHSALRRTSLNLLPVTNETIGAM